MLCVEMHTYQREECTLRDFIPDLQEIDAAFSAVRKKNATWIVTEDMKIAFEKDNPAVGPMKNKNQPPGK